uniref:Uncharacterized protein n=1 Tax=Knipowitschia caucasica TaxID=637954 RepID=A0AAV2MQX1_KNICA
MYANGQINTMRSGHTWIVGCRLDEEDDSDTSCKRLPLVLPGLHDLSVERRLQCPRLISGRNSGFSDEKRSLDTAALPQSRMLAKLFPGWSLDNSQ